MRTPRPPRPLRWLLLAACLAVSGARAGEPAGTAALSALGAPVQQAQALLESVTRELLGVRYRFGGADVLRGVDCSGLVRLVWQRLGLAEPPRTSAAMAYRGQAVPREALQPGDLVFFNTRGRPFSHVGIYLGDGRFVHASSVARRVTENALDQPYYRQRFNGARRLHGPEPGVADAADATAS
jgi:cell wall-associated NlpC family hydrolase